MILTAASALYGAAARWRRRWYLQNPSRQRRLSRPVVSVGNLRVGGSGKTPIVEHLAKLLQFCGERPAILTRGYARRRPAPGVTVVSDNDRVIEGFDTAGDEPLMLARALAGVPVLVGANRYESGKLAEDRFGATVHLLDDGFQHLTLARDVDLLAVAPDDLDDRVLPAGHLREPLDGATAAHALLVQVRADASDVDDAVRLQRALGVDTVFHVRRTIGEPRCVRTGARANIASGQQVFAFAGIARPERFFEDIVAAGWRLAGTLVFPDHHAFSDQELGRIVSAMRAAGAAVALTTEKDAVRLSGRVPETALIAAVPLAVSVEPGEMFRRWLLGKIRREPG